MAENQFVNRVVFGNQVVIDISDSTVNANTLLAGYKAYGANGEQVTGNVTLSYHITLTQAQYNELSDQEKLADENFFYITDADPSSVQFINDTQISNSKGWSSDKISKSISNPNLLDNPWFTINQRGLSSYTESNKYCFDRWVSGNISSGTISYDGGLSLAYSEAPQSRFTIVQYIENNRLDYGNVYTLSMLIKSSDANTCYIQLIDENNNYLLDKSTSLSANEWKLVTVTGNIASAVGKLTVKVWLNYARTANTTVVKAVKLEKGSISTLVMDTAPNYAEELLKCQRYFQVIPQYFRWRIVGYAANTFIGNINLACPMRTTPVLSNVMLQLRSLDQSTTALMATSQSVALGGVDSTNLLVYANYVNHGMVDGQINNPSGDLWISADL